MQTYAEIKADSTSQIITFDVWDSSSTTGAKLTGLTATTTGLTAHYNRPGTTGAAVAISLVNATKGTWTSGGFVAVDATNMPGRYELHLPNAALAAGVNYVYITLKGATNMVPVDIVIPLAANTAADNYAELTNATYGLSKLVRSTTPANTLDVASTGEAGLDFSNIKDATSTKTLENITVPTVTNVTNDVGITQAGADKAWNTTTRALTDKTGFSLSSAGNQAIWDVLTSALTTASSIGKFLIDRLDAAISSRLATSGYTAPDNSGIAAIKAKTDQLVFTIANKVDASIQAAADFAQGAADKIWNTTTRSLTDKAGFSLSSAGISDIWAHTTRTLTSFGTLVSDITSSVWSATTRTLTSFGTLVTSIWTHTTRRLTSAWTDETPSRDMAAVTTVPPPGEVTNVIIEEGASTIIDD